MAGATVGSTLGRIGDHVSSGNRVVAGEKVVVGANMTPGASVAPGAIVTVTETKEIAIGEIPTHEQIKGDKKLPNKKIQARSTKSIAFFV